MSAIQQPLRMRSLCLIYVFLSSLSLTPPPSPTRCESDSTPPFSFQIVNPFPFFPLPYTRSLRIRIRLVRSFRMQIWIPKVKKSRNRVDPDPQYCLKVKSRLNLSSRSSYPQLRHFFAAINPFIVNFSTYYIWFGSLTTLAWTTAPYLLLRMQSGERTPLYLR